MGCEETHQTFRLVLDQPVDAAYRFTLPPRYIFGGLRSRPVEDPEGLRQMLNLHQPHLKGGDYRDDSLSFRLALFDKNGDNRYDEPGIDMILLGAYLADTLMVYESAQAAYLTEDNNLWVAGKGFQVRGISPDGDWIDLQELSDPPLNPTVHIVDQLPDLEVEMLKGGRLPMSTFLKAEKYLYVELWSTWYQSSFESTPALAKTYERYQEQVEILSLVIDEVDYSRVFRHLKAHNVSWPQGIYTKELGQALLQRSIPYGALFSPEGKLIQADLDPDQLEKFLEGLL